MELNFGDISIGTQCRRRPVVTVKDVLEVVHRVSKNVTPLACCNFDTRERILVFFGQKCYR